MSAVTLTLDGFVFQDFEIPDEMPWGGAQSLSSKKLIGGARIVDAMGADDRPIEWTGRFRGADAVSRALQLDTKRRAGKSVALTWGQFSYQVKIASFLPIYQRDNEIPYSISCEVISQAPASTAASSIGVDQMVGADMASISSLSASIMAEAANPLSALALVNSVIQAPGAFLTNAQGLLASALGLGPTGALGLVRGLIAAPGVFAGTLGDLVGSLEDAISAIPNFATATRSDLAGVFSALGLTREAVAGCIATAEVDLGFPDAPGGVDAGVPAAQLVPILLAQASATQQASSLQDMASYLGRIESNLNALGASGAQTLMAGQDLYAVAASVYGDAAEWVTIAAVNGLSDPEIDGIQMILVPPTPSKADGVLAEILDAAPGVVTVVLPTPNNEGELDFSNPDNSEYLPGI